MTIEQMRTILACIEDYYDRAKDKFSKNDFKIKCDAVVTLCSQLIRAIDNEDYRDYLCRIFEIDID